MSASYIIEPGINTVFIKHTEKIDPLEFSAFFQELVTLPDFKLGINVWRDTRGAKIPKEWNYEFFRDQIEINKYPAGKELGFAKLAWMVEAGHQYSVGHQGVLSNHTKKRDRIERRIFREDHDANRP